jgi:hypothetical protein
MAKALIRAIRQDRDLWGTTYTAAIELAALVNDDTEVAETDYEKLARKMRRSVRTAQRHIKKLVECGKVKILPNLLMRTLENGKVLYRKAKNRYVFLIPWRREPAQKGMYDRRSFLRRSYDKMPRLLPNPTPRSPDRTLSLREELQRQETAQYRFPPVPGSDRDLACQEEMARLRALIEEYATAAKEAPCPAS